MRCFIPFFSIVLCHWACTSGAPRPAPPPKPSGLSGAELAKTHCAGCHLFPAPDLLGKTVWQKGVLPEMAYRLGIRPAAEKLGMLEIDEMAAVIKSGNYPDMPLLAEEDWQKIINYYVENAPEKPLPQSAKPPVKLGLRFFEVKTLPASEGQLPMLSMVKIDTSTGRLYACRREKGLIEVYDKSLSKVGEIPVESPVSDIAWSADGELLALEMGIMEPNDTRKGKLLRMDAQKQRHLVLDSLQRPVHLDLADLNQDGTPDYLICNFGNETGRLAWYDGKTRQEHVLKIAPGARNTLLKDMNNDGLVDIVALMCQAREGVSIFYNKGNGKFEEEIALQFSPVYGSSFIDLADMNADGHPDILYTNGDNADYSYSMKNYHGLRIFLNDGQNHFSEQYFYPIHGAGKVRAADFDADGDLDLAVTAFFTDIGQQPDEGFLFFENKGNLRFEITTFANTGHGKWLVMDVGDLDSDGRPDLVLGSFMKPGLGKSAKPSAAKPSAIAWLRNISKR